MKIELHTLNTGQPNNWMHLMLPTILDYAQRHGFELTVWDGGNTAHYPDPKFIIERILREFLASDNDRCMWIDADIWIHPDAPSPSVIDFEGWAIAVDAWHVDGLRKLKQWCIGESIPMPRKGWLYRNAGVWMCDKAGARVIRPHAVPPFRLGIMDQHQLNMWWQALPERFMHVLPVEWNRASFIDKGGAWFHHFCGTNKAEKYQALDGHIKPLPAP